MRLYFDCCCYNRPFDDLSQERVRLEADAILAIFALASDRGIDILRSVALTAEIEAISNKNRRGNVLYMYGMANGGYVVADENVAARTSYLHQHGLHMMDGMHIALAEKGNADIFFTVDDKLIGACSKMPLSLRVINPLVYIKEVLENEGEY